ncbi:NADH-quinone oxidoreductase subunit L [Jiulongibacter sediminis]|jgi:NADH-quinone oxidoreductase subunit L|uniref:NADH-quinone oxidoreductase subunit 5 family protein n=1 Tax=Jiulongibacter sediminis TaxID=1605367 RepID=UPI0026F2D2E9|nr:NADH-quinone oxidoreductase subunit L [Jiulongibacter sediminis]
MQAAQLIFSNLTAYLLGFALLILFRNKLSETLTSLLSILINLAGLILSILLILDFQNDQVLRFDWVKMGQSSFEVSLLVNRLTILMFTLVQFIALLVQVFSTKYMKGEVRFAHYFSYLNLFVFSMLGLVVSGNLLFLFVFWELVGFCSYLLIGFWFEKKSATDASLKAFLMNRIGDAGFLIGIGLVYFQFQTLDLTELSALNASNNSLLTLTALTLFCGCTGKSAQFPLQVWLPDAMEGPTPVSALIHAATMVAAGIFLLARIDFIITPDAGIVIATIGAVTSVLAAYSAIFQFDIKKVLAYSTVSQLGLLVMAIGVGATNAAIFHLFTHAFFKAGLFLIAGAVIHHFHHKQDMREMGGLLKTKPWLAVANIIFGAALAGLPLSSGFLSKDAVILSVYNWAAGQSNPLLMLIPLMGIVASVMTAFYVARQFTMVFLRGDDQKIQWKLPDLFELTLIPLLLASFWFMHSANPLSFEDSYFSSWFVIEHQQNHWVAYSLLAFAISAIILGFLRFKKEKTSPLSLWQKIGLEHFGIDHFYIKKVAPALVGNHCPVDELCLEPESKGIADVVSSFDTKALDGIVNEIGVSQKNLSKGLYNFDNGIVDGSVNLLIKGVIGLGKTGSFMDTKLVDGFIKFISGLVEQTGKQLRKIQSGQIQSYLMALIIIFVALLIFLASL